MKSQLHSISKIAFFDKEDDEDKETFTMECCMAENHSHGIEENEHKKAQVMWDNDPHEIIDEEVMIGIRLMLNKEYYLKREIENNEIVIYDDGSVGLATWNNGSYF